MPGLKAGMEGRRMCGKKERLADAELVVVGEVLSHLHRAESSEVPWPANGAYQAGIIVKTAIALLGATLDVIYEQGNLCDVQREARQTGAMCVRLLKDLEVRWVRRASDGG
jgi:hypothetical protein